MLPLKEDTVVIQRKLLEVKIQQPAMLTVKFKGDL
jgi:hypothetical protein